MLCLHHVHFTVCSTNICYSIKMPGCGSPNSMPTFRPSCSRSVCLYSNRVFDSTGIFLGFQVFYLAFLLKLLSYSSGIMTRYLFLQAQSVCNTYQATRLFIPKHLDLHQYRVVFYKYAEYLSPLIII
jgi:hypothetical protein